MKAVIVAAGSIGLNVKFGCMPAATATTIVSPTARETPSMYAATMPDKRGGHHDAQRGLQLASRPSRTRLRASSIGTARIASSPTELMYGTIMRPMTMPALEHVEARQVGQNFCSIGVTNSSAK